MSHETTSVRTKDGDCPVHIFRPDSDEALPAVIFYMDAFGPRPALFSMCERLAEAGYVVALPDLFYRAGEYPIRAPAEVFASPELQGELYALMGSIDPQRASEDAAFLLDYLESRSDVTGAKVGVTGYCLGGGIAISVAGAHPDRVGVAASFHSGFLVTDTSLSPHLFAQKAAGYVYVAGAETDEHYPPEMEVALDEALSSAGVAHQCERYEGTMHGWTVPDVPVFNEAGAERHWSTLLELLKKLPRD